MDKKFKFIAFTSLVFVMLIVLVQPTFADVGNSGGFGGGSSGGGFSGGGGGSFLFFGGGPFAIVVFIAFAAFRIYMSSKSNDGGSRKSAFDRSDLRGNESRTVASIKENDPDFSAEKFKSYASEIYITLQEAWEAKDWHLVRPFESNTLFNQHNRQLQEYISGNKTNHLNMQDVRQVDIADYHVDGDQEVLIVRLNSSLLDYITDDNTGRIIEGSDKNLQERSYRLEFIRTVGVKTDVQETSNTTNCPNCGAPTKVTTSGECEYCHSVITTGQYGWVLNKYGAWR